ncbi:hypothetical protein T10_2583 [Trichinella papuae]|uniref:Uncharacterized protein n=1 Tax=Trichinella papuae TaxID=268474 RepID=A0A0V1M7U7_9BILA|nr:hypothetical protein T10_2583 [Trichinella papuae]
MPFNAAVSQSDTAPEAVEAGIKALDALLNSSNENYLQKQK